MKYTRPRAQHFRSRGAELTYAAAIRLDGVELQELVEALQGKVGKAWPKTMKEQRARGAENLRRAADVLEGDASVKRYERLRRERPELGLQAVATLKRWLGVATWQEALELVGLSPASGAGETFGVEYGPRFGDHECTASIQAAAHDLQRVPSFNDYYAWTQRSDVIERMRTPRSLNTFIRHFGSFPNALVAAGLRNPDETVRRIDGSYWSGTYKTNDAAIIAGIKEIGDRMGRRPSSIDYERERELILEESRGMGSPRAVHSVGVIYRCRGRRFHPTRARQPSPRVRPS
jgi:hypothetical protein